MDLKQNCLKCGKCLREFNKESKNLGKRHSIPSKKIKYHLKCWKDLKKEEQIRDFIESIERKLNI